MIGFNHALTGTIIGIITPTPLIPVVALASHFIMDALPHFGEDSRFKPYTKSFKALLIFDAIICFGTLALGISLRPDMALDIALGAFFATLPDFLWLLESRAKGKLASYYFKFAKRIQRFESPDGWTYEVMAFCLLALGLSLAI